MISTKTEEELELELEQAAHSLENNDNSNRTEDQNKSALSPLGIQSTQPKKLKRSRADMLRDLQQKIAGASNSGASLPTSSIEITAENGQKKVKVDEPKVMKGFKVIEKAKEKTKKPSKQAKGHKANGNVDAELAPDLSASGSLPKIVFDSIEVAQADSHSVKDEDIDIFAGAGDYDDQLERDDGEPEDNQQRRDERTAEGSVKQPNNYFEDQDELVTKFEAYRSPTPPYMPSSIPSSNALPYKLDPNDSNAQIGPASGFDHSNIPPKPQRLEGLSSSSFSARDLLAYDDAQARDEARKLKKLKGKEKKEALAREAELGGPAAGPVISSEAKERDRLNREMQQYEKFERKNVRKSD